MSTNTEVKRPIGTENSPVALQIISIIDSYLSSSSLIADTAAQQLTDVVESNLTEDEYNAAYPIYVEVLYQIRTMKYDDPRQEALVSLLASLKASPFTKVAWPTLSPLGVTIRDLWNGALRYHSPDSWTSLNAFVARLTALEVCRNDVYSIWAFRPALEDDLDTEGLNANVPAAAVWLLYNSQRIWTFCVKNEKIGSAARGSPKWKGRKGFSPERWVFWAERFKLVSGTEGVTAETRQLVNKALDIMSSTIK